MFRLSKRWAMVAAIGHGVLFSLALTAALRIIYAALSLTLSERVAGNVFVVSSVVAGALAAYLYSRYQKAIDAARSN